MKILIIGPSWIGDMMMSQSLYRTLKAKYSYATIDVMSVAWCRPLLAHMPEINKALPMPISHGVLDIKTRWKLSHVIHANQYDHAYVLPNSFKSALIPFFAKIPQRTGWRGEMRYGLLNDLRTLNKSAFPLMVHRYMALAYKKGYLQCANDLPNPLLWPQLKFKIEEILKTTSEFNLTNHNRIIGFCLGSEFSSLKCWPHYHYATLAQSLIEHGYQIVLFGSKKECKISEKIHNACHLSMRNNCINLVGKTHLEQAMILLSSCRVIVSNDSGLMHIAAALNKPLVTLFGPSNPNFTPPLSNKATVIRLINGYYKIPLGNNNESYHQSLIDIKPKKVLKVVLSLLVD